MISCAVLLFVSQQSLGLQLSLLPTEESVLPMGRPWEDPASAEHSQPEHEIAGFVSAVRQRPQNLEAFETPSCSDCAMATSRRACCPAIGAAPVHDWIAAGHLKCPAPSDGT